MLDIIPVSLKEANVSAIRSDAGNLEQIKGNVTLNLNTGKDGTRQLDITFQLDVSDLDGSHVGSFDPEAYGVKLSDGYSRPETVISTMDPDTEKRFLEMAKTRFWLAGYTVDETMVGSARIESNNPNYEGERFYVDYIVEDHSAH